MAFLIDLTADLKQREIKERQGIFSDYKSFITWIDCVEQNEPRRVCRRPQLLRGWSDGIEQDDEKFSPEVRERAVRMVLEHRADHPRNGRRSARLRRRSAARRRRLRHWVRQAERDQGCGPARRAMSGSGSRRWSVRTASCARPTRSCARRRRILRRRSSTAGSNHDRVHRRSSRRPWGRADLPGAADRPVHLPCRMPRDARDPGQAARPRGATRPVRRSGGSSRQNFQVYGVRKVWRQLGARAMTSRAARSRA